jgi:hypothetical protein
MKQTPFSLFIRQCLLYPLASPFLPPENKVEKDYSYAAGQKTGTLEAGAGGGVPKTGQTTSYADYDDGYYQKGYPKTGNRFTNNGDGTITDNATGLEWVANPTAAGVGDSYAWADAIAACEGLTYAGHSDWRLPNVKELQSIIDFRRYNPTIDTTYFTSQSDLYWSSTTFANYDGFAWYATFYDGSVGYGDKTSACYIRPVRGG